MRGQGAVVLLDDLSRYKARQESLSELGRRLDECDIPWAVASTCQDGPELETVQRELGRLYDAIGLKLWLNRPTQEQKRELAEGIWSEAWNPDESDDYPTLGYIAMAGAMETMKRRFEDLSRNHPELADTLRALKLLDYAGIPYTNKRLQLVLKHEQLFRHKDLDLPRSLLALEDRGFLRPGGTDPIQPEPAYLRSNVVKYTPGTEPENDLDTLADVLEESRDYEGMFALARACAGHLEAPERAIVLFDRIHQLQPDNPKALSNKGNALDDLGRYEEALEAYSETLRIKPDDLIALNNKSRLLDKMGLREEAREVCREAHRVFLSQQAKR